MANKSVSKTEGSELKEKVKHLEAVIQNMFQNVVRLDAEISELKSKAKNKYITEKTAGFFNQQTWLTVQKVIISKPSTAELITDQAEQHDDLKCDMCEYLCKKKNIMKKHMNTKHNHNSIAKECSSKVTPEKVQDQQEQTKTNDDKDKN